MWYTELLNAHKESTVTNWQTYGIVFDGPLTDIETDNNFVVVPESFSQLTNHQLHKLYTRIDPLPDGDNGVTHFLNTVTIIKGLTEQ